MNREPHPTSGEDVVPRAVRRRREDATRARHRRLLAIDVAAALVLAVLSIALAPGLAIVALGSLLVLVGCAASLAYGRLQTRSGGRPRRR